MSNIQLMDDKDIEARFAFGGELINSLRMDLLAVRLTVIAILESHPDKQALLARLSVAAEHGIADTLTRNYPQSLVDKFQGDLEGVVAHTRGLLKAEQSQDKNSPSS